jgi:hypothetical protein
MPNSDPPAFIPPGIARGESEARPQREALEWVDPPGEMPAHLPPQIWQDWLDAIAARLRRAA